MKSKFIFVTLLLLGTFAQAIIPRPGQVIPVFRAELSEFENHVRPLQYPVPVELTASYIYGVNKNRPDTIKLKEGTGLRCVMAPCPSMKTSLFQIHSMRTNISGNLVTYFAHEISLVGLVNRTIKLDVYYGEELEMFLYTGMSRRARRFVGDVEQIYTIQ